jgi:hypothetical protein
LRHIAYAGGWKKFEPLWDWVIRARRVSNALPLLEGVLEGFGGRTTQDVAPGTQSWRPARRRGGYDVLN